MYTSLGIIGLFLLFWILWRLSSRQCPCPAWLGWLIETENPFLKINRAEIILQHLDLQEGMVVLDVGCGPGRLSVPIAKKVRPRGEVIAMDIQAGMLRRAEEKAQAENIINITFFHAGIGNKVLEHNKYDLALLVTVLGEISNRKAALQEIFNALKPKGILSITESIFDPHFQYRETVLQLATDIGFQEQKQFGSCIGYTINLEKPPS